MVSKINPTLPITENSRSKVVADDVIRSSKGMTRRGVYAAISYMACAVMLILFNKAALSSYKFPHVNVITLLQIICSCSFLYTLRRWKIISFTDSEQPWTSTSSSSSNNNPVTLVPLNILVHTLPLAFSYLLYMLASMESVRGINVPMYTTLRRTTVVVTLIVEYLFGGGHERYSYPVISSVGVIVLGAFVAGARDLSFDLYSYSVVFVANVCTAVYLASIARVGKSSGLNSFGLMWCNGIICGPILLFWTTVQGDLQMLVNFPHLSSLGFQAVMILSCIMAFMLNYTVFWNTTLNSALTQTICGNLKDVLTVVLGWLIFGGLPFDPLNIAGQFLGFMGSSLYAYCKLTAK